MKLARMAKSLDDRTSKADAAGYFVGRLEGEAKGDKSIQEVQTLQAKIFTLSRELKVAIEKSAELEITMEKRREENLTESSVLANYIKQLETEKLKLGEDCKYSVGRANARVQEAEYFRDEAIRNLEVAQQRANDRAMTMADERIRAAQQSHDLLVAGLVKEWEERLEQAKIEGLRNIAKVEREASLRMVERSREMESRHGEEMRRREEEYRNEMSEVRTKFEREIEGISADNEREIRERERAAAEELRNGVEEERNKWQLVTNELREDCNVQVQNIRRVLVGEQKNFEEAKVIMRKDFDNRMREMENSMERDRIITEEKYSKRVFLHEQKWQADRGKLERREEERVSALQSLLQMKTSRIAELEKMLGFGSWLSEDNIDVETYSERQYFDDKSAFAASRTSSLPHPLTPQSQEAYTNKMARSAARSRMKANLGTPQYTQDSLLYEDDEGREWSVKHRHPPPNHPPPPGPLQPEGSSPILPAPARHEWFSPATKKRAVKTVETQELQSKKHVDSISEILRRSGPTSDPTSSPINPVGGLHHDRRGLVVGYGLTATQKMGISMAFRALSKHARSKRNLFFYFWADLVRRRELQLSVLRRIITRRKKMSLLMAFHNWLTKARSSKIVHYNSRLDSLQRTIETELDGRYEDFVSRLESMRYENEVLLASQLSKQSHMVMDELKKEVGRVEEELEKVSSQVTTSLEMIPDAVRSGVRESLSPPKEGMNFGGEECETPSSSSDLAAGGIGGSFHERVRFYKSRYGGT